MCRATPGWPLIVAVLGFSMIMAANVDASLIGESIEISRQSPPISFVDGPFPYVVGTSSPVALSGGDNLFASATANDLDIEFGPDRGDGSPAPDTEFILFDNLFTGTSQVITGVSVVNEPSEWPTGFVSSDVTFTNHSVSVYDTSDHWTGSQSVEIAVQTATVPEPSSIVLLAVGAMGLGGATFCRRRKRQFCRARAH